MLNSDDSQTAIKKIKDRFKEESRCTRIQNMLDLVSNPFRFKIICVLAEGDFPVADIVELVGGKASNISQQLKILFLAGYVNKERKGKQIYYHLASQAVKELFDFLHILKII